jgi:hypothetical protein
MALGDVMRRPVFGAGSWHEETQRASLASYEAFTSLRFLKDGLGRRVESNKLDKYIINGNEYLDYTGNPLGNKSRPAEDYFPRMNWSSFTKRLDATKLWKRFYRMSKESFLELLDLAREGLERDEIQGLRSSYGGVVSPELRLSMTLRWLAGGSYVDIAIIHGVAISTFYKVVNSTVESLDNLEPLMLQFPLQDERKLWGIAEGFQKKAGHTIFNGVVGALDGILVECEAPNRNKCKNPVSFWTRKSKYAWNVQAVCDANRDFLYVSVICPGSTHDSHAWSLSSLGRTLKLGGQLKESFYLIADSAYRGHACIMTPFDGHNLSTSQDSYNFHLSSLRINIECAFGTLSCAFSLSVVRALWMRSLSCVCAVSCVCVLSLSLSLMCDLKGVHGRGTVSALGYCLEEITM